ncbi:MAG: hypothetical protein Q4C56_03560 [Peptococcaceae bacterium]|nr:hypothetical protein [Peptococcaceae bacterium]
MTRTTSYNSLGKDLRLELGRLRSFILLFAIVYLAAGPVLLGFSMVLTNNRISDVSMLSYFFVTYFTPFYWLAIIAGFLGGLYATRYQTVPSQSNFYHSLPATRAGLLSARVLALALVEVVLLVMVTLVAIVAGLLYASQLGADGVGTKLLAAMGLHFGYILLLFAISLATTLFAGQLTANTIGQVLMTVAIHVVLPLTAICLRAGFTNFTTTYVSTGLVARLSHWNVFYNFIAMGRRVNDVFDGIDPVFMTSGEAAQYLNVSALCWPTSSTVIYVILTALFFVLTYLLYQRRPVERAGDTLVYAPVGSFVKGVFVLLGGMVATLFGGKSLPVAILCMVIAAAIVHIVAELIYSRDRNGIRHHLASTAVGLALALAVGIIMQGGYFGADDKLPQTDDIEAATISLYDENDGVLSLDNTAAQNPTYIKKVMAVASDALSQRVTTNGTTDIVTAPLDLVYRTAAGGYTRRSIAVPREQAAEILAPVTSDGHSTLANWSTLATATPEDLRMAILHPNGISSLLPSGRYWRVTRGIETEPITDADEARLKALLKAVQTDMANRSDAVLKTRIIGFFHYVLPRATDYTEHSYPIYAGDKETAALIDKWRADGILDDERTNDISTLETTVIKSISIAKSGKITLGDDLDAEAVVDAWLAGDLIGENQAVRNQMDVDTRHGVGIYTQPDEVDQGLDPDIIFYYRKGADRLS